jgi:hypothetical protein
MKLTEAQLRKLVRSVIREETTRTKEVYVIRFNELAQDSEKKIRDWMLENEYIVPGEMPDKNIKKDLDKLFEDLSLPNTSWTVPGRAPAHSELTVYGTENEFLESLKKLSSLLTNEEWKGFFGQLEVFVHVEDPTSADARSRAHNLGNLKRAYDYVKSAGTKNFKKAG